MQINTVYTRSLIQTMAGKAIRDLRSGGERELRNVMELCKGHSGPPGYQKFWSLLETILRRPDQQYGALLSRAANDVDINCLKTLIANLGLHACAHGSQALRDSWNSGVSPAYWMEPLDGNMEPDILHQTISRLQKQGTSSFLFRAEQKTDLENILNVAAKHHQCVFFLIVRTASCCRTYLEDMAALGNVIPLVSFRDLPSIAGAFKQTGILFGFHRRYCEIESPQAEEDLLRQCIETGCFLGVYEGTQEAACKHQELVYYTELHEIRRRGTQEILLADLWRDREAVQELLLQQNTLPDGPRNGKCAEGKQ